METLLEFNGVRVLLTTGQQVSEVQNFIERADVIISVYPWEHGGAKVLWQRRYVDDESSGSTGSKGN